MALMHVVLVLALTRRVKDKPSRFTLALCLTALALLISMAAFFGSIGPSRNANYDQSVMTDLQTISVSVQTYTNKHHALPVQLSDLSLDNDLSSRIASRNYRYVPQDATKFQAVSKSTSLEITQLSSANLQYQLCAVFKAASPQFDTVAAYSRATFSSYDLHPAGDYCFSMDVYSSQYIPPTSTNLQQTE